MGSKYLDRKPIIIFSVFRSDAQEFHNEDCHQVIKNVFDDRGINYKELIGFYKGNKEKSLLVFAEHEEKIKELCKQFKQECYLYADSDRDAFLVYPNKTEKIGRLKSTTKEVAEKHDNYTYDPNYQMYWITE